MGNQWTEPSNANTVEANHNMIVFRDRFTDVSVGKAPWILHEGDLYLGKVGEDFEKLAARHSEDPKKMLHDAIWGTVWMHHFEPSGEVNFISKTSKEIETEVKESFEDATQELPKVKWS